jgi:hypothetical protein
MTARLLFACVFLASPLSVTNASECSSAVNNYNSNMYEMLSTVVRLHRCVANSRGTDDCSSAISSPPTA